jgi:hypothetical protein
LRVKPWVTGMEHRPNEAVHEHMREKSAQVPIRISPVYVGPEANVAVTSEAFAWDYMQREPTFPDVDSDPRPGTKSLILVEYFVELAELLLAEAFCRRYDVFVLIVRS